MADSYLIDTNILLRISRLRDPEHSVVDGALFLLLERGSPIFYTHQTVAEFWNVWTRPADRNGFGLSPASARIEIANLQGFLRLSPESRASYEKWLSLVSDYSVAGVKVHDARLVATMLANGVQNLLTLNVADFDRYRDLIRPVHPREILQPQAGNETKPEL